MAPVTANLAEKTLLVVAILLLLRGAVIERSDNNDDENYQYSTMIDAGSSGSRIRVFRWRQADVSTIKSIELSGDDCEDVEPGVSSFVKDPKAAVETLLPLISCAERHIPRAKHATAHIYLRATAGVRMLPAEQQPMLMKAIAHETCPLVRFECHPSQFIVLSGEDEGAFLWLTVNHQLRSFTSSRGIDAQVGVLDMGGGSTQIASAISENEMEDVDEGNVMTIQVPGYLKPQRVFSMSILGGGMRTAGEAVHALAKEDSKSRQRSAGVSQDEIPIPDPCTHEGRPLTSKIDGELVDFIGTGDVDKCNALIRKSVSEKARCVGASDVVPNEYGRRKNSELGSVQRWNDCYFQGAKLPALSSHTFYGVSNYFYVARFFHLGESPSIDEIRGAATEYCKTSWASVKAKVAGNLNEPYEEYCFRALYLCEFLENGLGFNAVDHVHLHYVHELLHSPADWTTGAMLATIDPVEDNPKHWHTSRLSIFLLLLVLFMQFGTARQHKDKTSPRGHHHELDPFVP